MKYNSILIALLISSAALLLLSMLAYPFGYDQAVFAVGGEMSNHGAVAYRDFIDTKPSLIFWIYGAALWIFGHHEWSIRVVDILYHCASIFVFYKILRQQLADRTIAIGSCLLYILYYTSSGFWMTAQTESFAFLPSILLFHSVILASTGKEQIRNGVTFGVCAAILILLKFTFVAVPIAGIFWLLLQSQEKQSFQWSFYLSSISCIALLVGSYILYLIVNSAWQPFVETMQWLGGYRLAAPISTTSSPIVENPTFKMYSTGFLGAFGLSGIILLAIGIWSVVRSKLQQKPIYYFFLLQIFTGFLAILSEKKSMDYHYIRILWCAVPLICYGLLLAAREARAYSKQWFFTTFIKKTIISGLFLLSFALGLYYSPIIRLNQQPIFWAKKALKGENLATVVQQTRALQYNGDSRIIAEHLKDSIKQVGDLFLFGNTMNIYFDLNTVPAVNCLTNAPFITSWTLPELRRDLLHKLETTPPKYFLVETDDARVFANGTELDSYQLFLNWEELSSFVKSDYQELPSIGHFHIFKLGKS